MDGSALFGEHRDFRSSGSEKAPVSSGPAALWPAHQSSMAGERLEPEKGNTARPAMRRVHGVRAMKLSNAGGFHGLSGQARARGGERKGLL